MRCEIPKCESQLSCGRFCSKHHEAVCVNGASPRDLSPKLGRIVQPLDNAIVEAERSLMLADRYLSNPGHDDDCDPANAISYLRDAIENLITGLKTGVAKTGMRIQLPEPEQENTQI